MSCAHRYKIVTASAIPEIPYITFLDQYVLASTFVSALVAVQSGLAHTLQQDGDPNNTSASLSFDYVSGMALLAVWLSFNIYMFARWTWMGGQEYTAQIPMPVVDGDIAVMPDGTANGSKLLLRWAVPLSPPMNQAF